MPVLNEVKSFQRMKHFIPYIFIFCMAAGLIACHDLDEPATTELTPDVFPKDSLQFVAVKGTAYAALRGNYSLDYWFMQSLSTDEAILPARGGNWYDNQNYMMLHYHSWTKDHGWTNGCWSWLSRVIGTTNQAISILKTSEPDTYYSKKNDMAELRMVRAFAYFMMMDLYGNVPLDTVYGDFTQHPTISRAQVFNFIESEVKAAIPNLSSATGNTTYGLMTKYAAYALLAKMYLNASIYTGTERNNDCIAACDYLISSGKFSLAPRSTYLKMFYPDNGPATPEFIFAIPYDPTASASSGTNGYMYHARYDVPRSLKAKFNLPFTPSAPESTLPEFYAYFEDDANDIRNQQWLTGLQYMNDGVTPVTVTTTNQGYDYTYNGGNPSGSYTYQVNLTPAIILRYDPNNFDLGNDEIAWNMGYRNIKFYPDATSTSRNQNNDVPVFRYADIILMKAEAILRGGTPTLGDQALTLVNQLRANRTTSGDLGSVDLQFIYEERAREFAWEAWHRNDMIRFGTYEQSWGFKTDADPHKRLFPIPTIARRLNTQLQQNEGYQ